jgi:hypothetical protein
MDCRQATRAAPNGAAKREIRSSNCDLSLGKEFMFFLSKGGRRAARLYSGTYCCVNPICRRRTTRHDAGSWPRTYSLAWENGSGSCGRLAGGPKQRWPKKWGLTGASSRMSSAGSEMSQFSIWNSSLTGSKFLCRNCSRGYRTVGLRREPIYW